MLAPESSFADVIVEQWPFVVVVLITAIKIVKRLDCLRECLTRGGSAVTMQS